MDDRAVPERDEVGPVRVARVRDYFRGDDLREHSSARSRGDAGVRLPGDDSQEAGMIKSGVEYDFAACARLTASHRSAITSDLGAGADETQLRRERLEDGDDVFCHITAPDRAGSRAFSASSGSSPARADPDRSFGRRAPWTG